MGGSRARSPRPGRTTTPSPASSEHVSEPLTGPVRTCVGCRMRDAQDRLVRLALVPGTLEVTVDERRTVPGRGAWLHPQPGCVERAVARRAVDRALRIQGADVSQIEARLVQRDR